MTQQALDYWKSEILLKKITALDSSVPKWLIEEEVTKYSENTVLLVSKIKISSLFKKNIYIYFSYTVVYLLKKIMWLKHLNVLPNYGNVSDVVWSVSVPVFSQSIKPCLIWVVTHISIFQSHLQHRESPESHRKRNTLVQKITKQGEKLK